MKTRHALPLLLTLCLAVGQAASASPWPKGAKAAVSLAYDDALDSQLDNAIPVLDRHGLKGSFYLQLSQPSVAKRLAEWRAAAARGHELGNHTLFHQCSASLPDRDWVQRHRNVDTTSAAQMKDQAILANTMLHAIDGKTERTFTTPCGDGKAAGGEDYIAGLRGEFVGMKTGSGSAVVPSMATLDPDAVLVMAPVGLSGAQLIALVKEAAAKGTMVNFTFHGIGGDYLGTSKEAHEELLRYLAANRDIYWTDTFVAIMKHVRKSSGRR